LSGTVPNAVDSKQLPLLVQEKMGRDAVVTASLPTKLLGETVEGYTLLRSWSDRRAE